MGRVPLGRAKECRDAQVCCSCNPDQQTKDCSEWVDVPIVDPMTPYAKTHGSNRYDGDGEHSWHCDLLHSGALSDVKQIDERLQRVAPQQRPSKPSKEQKCWICCVLQPCVSCYVRDAKPVPPGPEGSGVPPRTADGSLALARYPHCRLEVCACSRLKLWQLVSDRLLLLSSCLHTVVVILVSGLQINILQVKERSARLP